MLQDILDLLVILLYTVYESIWCSIKAILPLGVLPRKDVKGEIVLITGAGSGLGRLTAVQFGELGAKVVLWDINEKGNEETKQMVLKTGAEVHAYTVDLSKKEQIYEAAEKVKKTVGDVDILINNAGIVTGKKLFECPDHLMELTMAVNTHALLFTGKAFIPSMLERNHGHICTIASMAGKAGCAGLVDYCASKHGAVGFHESLTLELAAMNKTGVKTTVICPFFIDTGMFDGVQTKSPTLLPILQPDYVVDNIVEGILTNRNTVLIPRFSYLILFCASFLPSNVALMLARHFGTDESMDTFKGRTKN